MPTKNTLWIIGILSLFMVSCIDKYEPDLDGFQQLLVVDGGVFDGEGPFTIKLSMSTDVYMPRQKPVSRAYVTIEDNQGNSYVLNETADGLYSSDGSGLIGTPGNSYRLNITSFEGKHYQSNYEILRPSVPIDALTYKLEFHKDERYPYQLAGYQFYLNTSLPSDTNRFYMWRFVKTYEYHSEFLADAYYKGRIYEFPKPDSLQVCWKTENVKKIITLNTNNILNLDLQNFPLNFVNTEGRELSVRYSQLTEQLSLNEDAVRYYKTIEEGNGEQGSLYTQQPYQVLGNVHCIDNTDETVLGYFLVAGKTAVRLFAAPPEVEFHYYEFVLTADDYRNMRFIKYSSPAIWPIYLTTGNSGNPSLAWPSQECIDCRQRGGTLSKPEFWDR